MRPSAHDLGDGRSLELERVLNFPRSLATGPKALRKTAQGKRGTSATLGNAVRSAYAPPGQNRILVVPRWGVHRFGKLTQGGARYTRLPRADLLSTFGARRLRAKVQDTL